MALTPPKPPPKKETRKHPRFELFATVELKHGEETLVLPARNISLGGMYLAADGNDLSLLKVGEEVGVTLFDALNEAQPYVRGQAQVVRHEGKAGLALSWTSSDPVIARKLVSLLERLSRAGGS
jgi:hypothetical protein